jgi:hypothetical protein
MPPLPPASMATRKRTRSTNVAENNADHQQTSLTNLVPTTTATSVNISSRPTSTAAVNAPPKRQRNNPPSTGPPPPVPPRTNYSFRNRSLTPDPRHPSARFPSLNAPSARPTTRQRYNLRPRRSHSQIRLPHVPTPNPTIIPRRIRRPIPPILQTTPSSSTTNINSSTSALLTNPSPPSPVLPTPVPILPGIPQVTLSTPPVIQPRQYRLVYISDDDDEIPTTAQATLVNTTLNLITDDEDEELLRPQHAHRRTSRLTPGTGLNTR